MSEELLPHYRNPVGEGGREVIERMYSGHAAMTRALVAVLEPKEDDVILDVGCGGGFAISLFAQRAMKVYGIDHSELSVEKALAFNADAVREGRVAVEKASVLDMPFADGMFTLVTALETVYFWDRAPECYARIFRALRPGGRFAILVEAWLDGDTPVNEPERMDILRMKLYSPEEFAADLRAAGFDAVEWREITDDRTLCVIAHKKA